MRIEDRPLPFTYAALVFKGDALDTKMVTDILERSPTLSYRKGDEYKVRDTTKTRPFGLWLYSTRNRVDSKDLGTHVDTIEELLIGSNSVWPNSRISKIQKLVCTEEAKLRVDVFWYGAREAAVPKIGRSFDQVVTMAGGTIATDFHRDGDAVEAA